VFAQRAVTGGGLTWWVATGAVTAVGILAKYNMVVFPASVGLFLLTSRSRWAELARPGVWVMGLVSLLGLVPIVIWNANHEWMGFKHVFALTGFFAEHTAVKHDRGIDPTALPHFLGGQFVLLLGYWFVAWVAAMVAFRPWKVTEPRTALLWWTSLPIWAVFFVAGIKSKGQLNWPVAAYLSGFVLAVAWVARQVTGPAGWYRTAARACLGTAILVGILGTLVFRYPGPMRSTIARFVAVPTEKQPIPVRKYDPTGRLAGWQELATRVDAARDRVRAEEGVEPLVAAMVWHQPGELGFYCRGNPKVYSFGPAIADRYSQYDVWRPNPVADAQVFRGRTFVYVGDYNPSLQMAFDRMDGPVEVIASDGTVPVAEWKLWVLRGFKGFPGRQGKGY
jgi:4-amino-4-deoxy-L-arabinose transferase-like glycosyltransferase